MSHKLSIILSMILIASNVLSTTHKESIPAEERRAAYFKGAGKLIVGTVGYVAGLFPFMLGKIASGSRKAGKVDVLIDVPYDFAAEGVANMRGQRTVEDKPRMLGKEEEDAAQRHRIVTAVPAAIGEFMNQAETLFKQIHKECDMMEDEMTDVEAELKGFSSLLEEYEAKIESRELNLEEYFVDAGIWEVDFESDFFQKFFLFCLNQGLKIRILVHESSPDERVRKVAVKMLALLKSFKNDSNLGDEDEVENVRILI